ncbi:MAG: inositol monophosphatase [Deltaproteobacteria bacterium]|jgi:myo-inositol-1(or 4)-monophosphatase|nr:inositol monophosphatase [Deltaproteobacteria bacterium]
MKLKTKVIKNCLQNCSNSDIRDILSLSAAAAKHAGGVLLERFEKPHQIQHKGSIDLVTEADLASEELILEILQKNLPGIKILSEESFSSYSSLQDEPIWIIDPLDGTTNFAHNFPWFSVSIAFYDKGGSQVGVIYCPTSDEMFCSTSDGGAWLNDQRIKVSEVNILNRALVATGFPYDVQERPDSIMAMLKAVLSHSQGVRRPGAATLDLACLACGRLDAFWEVGLKPWDTAAGYLLVEEAGGMLSTFSGEPFSPFNPEILASNSLVHGDMIGLLKEFSSAPTQV